MFDSTYANPDLIHTRFVWAYGGRQVSICGSFTRWSDHIPLSPAEECPTVFQVILALPPGSHQGLIDYYLGCDSMYLLCRNYRVLGRFFGILFWELNKIKIQEPYRGSRSDRDIGTLGFSDYLNFKFFVDGEWKHDEHLPSVNGSYGVVNTVLLTKNPNMIPASYSPETPRSNMDVDHDPFLRIESVPSLTEADIEISRHRLSAFLSSHTAYELLPESGKVVALDKDLPVKQAFHILHEQGVSVAPLWDSNKGQFIGVLSSSDFILILRELGTHGSNLTEEELETHTISAWKEGKLQLTMQAHGSSRSNPRHLVHAGPDDSLKDVALKVLQNKVASVPIIHSSAPDGSFPQLLHLASLSEILHCICRHFRHSSSSLPVLQQPISALPIGTWVPKPGEPNGRPFAILRPNASLGSALSFLIQADVSSVPVVDNNDSLLDIYCRSDITALAKDRAYAKIHLDEMSIHEALQLGQDATYPYGFLNGQRCQMCLRSDSLHKVMERLSNTGVRRLVIVEAGSKRVEGVISLSDVFRFLLG